MLKCSIGLGEDAAEVIVDGFANGLTPDDDAIGPVGGGAWAKCLGKEDFAESCDWNRFGAGFCGNICWGFGAFAKGFVYDGLAVGGGAVLNRGVMDC